MIIFLLIKTAISLLIAIFVGYLAIRLIIPEKNYLSYVEYFPLSYVSGLSIITVMMLLLSLLGIPFSFMNTLITILIFVTSILILMVIKRKKLFGNTNAKWLVSDRLNSKKQIFYLNNFMVLIIASFVLLSFVLALFYPMQGWDSVAHWGIKSKIFFINENVTFQKFDLHNEYPNFIPLAETWIYNCIGNINDRIVMILFPLFLLSLLMIFYILQRKCGFSKFHALFFTLLLILSDNVILQHSFIAYSDLTLTFVYSTGLLMLFLWMINEGLKEYFIIGSLFVGMSLWIKIESITLVFVALFLFAIFMITEKRHWKYFFIFFISLSLFYLPWFLYCSINNIAVSARYNIIIPDLHTVANVLSHFIFSLWKSAGWTAFFVISIFSANKIIKGNNKFIQYLVAAVYLNLSIIVFTYLLNPEAYFTMKNSMNRLMMHILPLALFYVSCWFNDFSKEFKKKDIGIENSILSNPLT